MTLDHERVSEFLLRGFQGELTVKQCLTETPFNFRLAAFSPCEKYRYVLISVWEDKPISKQELLAYIMLNPSTADEMKNDPTVERCEVRARNSGYSGFIVLNRFPYRSTDPKGLVGNAEENLEVYGKNFRIINQITERKNVKKVICAWGNNKVVKNDYFGEHYLISLSLFQGKWCCLKRNKDGSPAHPLYLPYDKPEEIWP